MALYLYRINWLYDEATIAGGDTIVWGYHLESSTVPDLGLIIENWELAFGNDGTTPLAGLIPAVLEIESHQLYDVVNGGPPIAESLPVLTLSGAGGAAGVSEVQLVVSRWVNDGLGRPFKKGRSYVGPLSGTAIAAVRPTTQLMNACLDFTVGFHNRQVGDGFTPVVDTKGALHVPETIVQYSVDNAWDTQRRRGIDPTAETVVVP